MALALSVAGMAEPACGVAMAQAAADRQLVFDIPAQPLDAALALYFRVTGVQLLYDSALTAGRRSSAVRGSFTPREALRLLLHGSGLIARYSRANAAIIARPETTSSTPLVPLGRVIVREHIAPRRISPLERLAYYQQLETELQARLRDDRRTVRLVFSVVAELRVDDDGKLSAVRIDRGSGDRKIDQAISEALSEAKVTPPPPLLDQPLSIALRGTRR